MKEVKGYEGRRNVGCKTQLGGSIYIHGNCVTIGCIPLGDENIMELYVLAVKARSNGQMNIPVHLFPFKMENKEMAEMLKKYQADGKLCEFWKELKVGFDAFEANKVLPVIKVDEKGKYILGH